jgi:hypothetical protein
MGVRVNGDVRVMLIWTYGMIVEVALMRLRRLRLGRTAVSTTEEGCCSVLGWDGGI